MIGTHSQKLVTCSWASEKSLHRGDNDDQWASHALGDLSRKIRTHHELQVWRHDANINDNLLSVNTRRGCGMAGPPSATATPLSEGARCQLRLRLRGQQGEIELRITREYQQRGGSEISETRFMVSRPGPSRPMVWSRYRDRDSNFQSLETETHRD